MKLLKYLSNSNLIITSIFLLIMVQSGGYIAQLFTCKLQKLLTVNMLAKHLVLFIVIYAAVMLTDTNYKISPKEHASYSIVIYLIFLLFIKMTIKLTLLTIAILLLIFIINHYIEYYKNIDPKKHKETVENLQNIKNSLMIFIIILIAIGFILYFIEKRDEYKQNWSTFKFIFGVNQCKSLQNI